MANEKDFYKRIGNYYEAHATNNMAVEAKITKTNRLPFSCLMPHQESKLIEAEKVLYHKEADSGVGQKNFDIYILYRATAVVIAIYYKPRETEVYEIGIRAFVNEKYLSTEKSLTKERAAIIGKRIII